MFTKILIPIFIILSLSSNCFSQDSEQVTSVSAFAEFLYASELYDFAIEEYERLNYHHPDNVKYLQKLLSSYKKSKRKYSIQNRLDHLVSDNVDLNKTYIDLLIKSEYNDEANTFFQSKKNVFSKDESDIIAFKLGVGNKSWNEVQQLYNDNTQPSKFEPIIQKIKSSKFKRPGLASVMSAIIPGSGRVYAKDTKDGVISFIFIGASAYQSYRGFKKNGVKSVGGWIFGGISLGYYISNIYGSYMSAKYYNSKKDDQIYNFALPIIME